MCQNVPQIKFHNPAVKVALESKDSDNSEIIFVAGVFHCDLAVLVI